MNKSHRLLNIITFLVFCTLAVGGIIQNGYASTPPNSRAASAADCFNFAKTQLDLDQCASKDLANSEASVEALYNKLLSIYANNTMFTEKLERSQSKWTLFTQMQLSMKYPHNNEDGYYGSVYPMCVAEYLSSLYAQRVEALSPIAMQLQGAVQHTTANQTSTTLKQTYLTITSEYSDDKVFMSAFQAANMAWEQYQDAQLAAMFTQGSNKLFDGTLMSANDYRAALQMQRITGLRDWISGIEEGDSCSGSVKTPEELSDSN